MNALHWWWHYRCHSKLVVLFFQFFFIFWVKQLANCIRFWIKMLTILRFMLASHLSLQKGWVDFSSTRLVILVWYGCVRACCPSAEQHCAWQTGHRAALVVQAETARSWSAWSESLFYSTFQNATLKGLNSSPYHSQKYPQRKETKKPGTCSSFRSVCIH